MLPSGIEVFISLLLRGNSPPSQEQMRMNSFVFHLSHSASLLLVLLEYNDFTNNTEWVIYGINNRKIL